MKENKVEKKERVYLLCPYVDMNAVEYRTKEL